MPAPSADRNLLFGILAVQLDFVTRDALIDAMNAWLLDKARPLGEVMRDRGGLSAGRLQLLDALVAEHLQQHGGDPRQSLAALSSVEPALRQSLAAVADDEVRHTLLQVGAARPEPPTDGTGTLLQPPTTAPTPGLRYRVLRPHARGGLGEVFVAEDTELGRHVALKEIQGRHADDHDSRSRFVLEAEITGGLEHPGIVPVYGLGSYADGRPYYAMRFIKGDNLKDALTRFHAASPDFASLAFRDLLRRFVDVCNAIAYAHARGVLHRDLKPGNVMLGKYGETLVVDWGLAKALGRSEPSAGGDATLMPRSAGDSSATVAGQAMGTPAYMSPEQADGRLADLGPATDVYSLGATLYELLTGRVAFAGRTVSELLDAVKAGRFPPPRAVLTAVPPALDAVCRKAMALRPAARYPSATDVARDVERWLADEPVVAYPEPTGVRLRRWVRRHARLVTGVAAALAVGVASLSASTLLLAAAERRERAERTAKETALAVAERERDAKEAERTKVAAERDRALAARHRTRDALDAMVSGVTGDSLTTQKEVSAEQKAFLQSVLKYYEEFAAEPGEDRVGRERLAAAHLRLAQIRMRLGQLAELAAVSRRAAALYGQLVADFPAVPEYRRGLGRSHHMLGYAQSNLRDFSAEEMTARAALATFETLVTDFPASPEYRSELALSHHNLGVALEHLGKNLEAESACKAALAVYEKLAADFPAVPDYRRGLGSGHHSLGVLLSGLSGRRSEAEAAFRMALGIQERLAADLPAAPEYRRDLGRSQSNLGVLLNALGRRPEAEAAYRAAVALYETLTADYPAVVDYRSRLAIGYNNLSNSLKGQRKWKDAEVACRRALELFEKLSIEQPEAVANRWSRAYCHGSLGAILREQGRHAESEASLRAAVKQREQLIAESPKFDGYRLQLKLTQLSLAGTLVAAGKVPEAVALADEIANGPAPAELLYDSAYILAIAAAATNPDAEAHAARAVALLRQAVAAGYRNIPHILKDADLDPLRRRDDYAALLWDLADGLPAEKR